VWCASQSGQCGERLCHFILVRFWLLFKLPHKVPFVADPDMSSNFVGTFIPRRPSTISVAEIPAVSRVSIRADANRSRLSLSQRLPAPKLTKGSPHLFNSTPQSFGLSIY